MYALEQDTPDPLERLYESAASLSLSHETRVEISENLLKAGACDSLTLIPLKSRVCIEDLRALVPEGPIVACDFYIDDIEQFDSIDGGYHCKEESLINIDHHAPTDVMFRFVSSGSLAIDYVKAYGPLPEDTCVIINHTDCDSVVSALIMRGIIPPLDVFDDAVIAADHTGDPHPIADLLQALDVARDVEFSARNLALLLKGEPLEADAAYLYSLRMKGRELTRDHIDEARHWWMDDIVFVPYISGLRSEFLPSLLPNAALIVTLEEPHKQSGHTTTRMRLGKAAPEGFTLFSLEMGQSLDPAFGGRWNAGSNKRGGGTSVDASQYAHSIHERYQEWLSNRGQGPDLSSVSI